MTMTKEDDVIVTISGKCSRCGHEVQGRGVARIESEAHYKAHADARHKIAAHRLAYPYAVCDQK